ncbi:MAG: long-chain fatty acid--CoA ligase [Actinobacteria bacterium]|nr:MAG: long-chain fatty acid--CoA ligase [Actinomycetota bacterium]
MGTPDVQSATELKTMAELPAFAGARHGDTPALRFKRGGEWQECSYRELEEVVRGLAGGLIDLGVGPGDRVCVLANTRPEWTHAALAISCAGAIVVPIYPTNSPEECEWVAGNSGAVALIAEDEHQLDKVRAVRERLPDLRRLVVMDGEAPDATPLQQLRGGGGDPAELERRVAGVSAQDPLLFIYTSGTTGPPKGCMLSHGNGTALCDMVEQLGIVRPGDVSYLYLPLAHVFAQLIELSGLYLGATLAYFGGDTKQIIPELQDVCPDYLPSVPRIFEKLYALATAPLEKASPEEREQFAQAVKLGVKVRALEARGEPIPDQLRGPFEQADNQIFKKVRSLFGERLREANTGAAPIAPEILEFFYAAGCPVMEGYGLTETTGVGTVCTREHFRFGTVGRPIPRVEVRIGDDGEILMRGPNVFVGYWRNEEATREVLDDDGWLHTGDLGELDDDGFLKITGRKKDIIITAGGKNLAPANVENDLKQSRWISQAVMYGDRRPYPVALITLDPEEIGPWAREQGLAEDLAALADEDRVRELVQGIVDDVNKRYAQVEQIKRFAILDHDLSQETGELTPTLKVKRNVVYDRYEEVFESLYAR